MQTVGECNIVLHIYNQVADAEQVRKIKLHQMFDGGSFGSSLI
jgi:hypothetical protein